MKLLDDLIHIFNHTPTGELGYYLSFGTHNAIHTVGTLIVASNTTSKHDTALDSNTTQKGDAFAPP